MVQDQSLQQIWTMMAIWILSLHHKKMMPFLGMKIMALQIHPPPKEVIQQIIEAIDAAIESDSLEVNGSGGHFEIRVVSEVFRGKNTLAKQRLVYSAIAHLMKGDAAPVHAVDRLETIVPGETT